MVNDLLKKNLSKLYKFLENKYSLGYVRDVKALIRAVLDAREKGNWTSYDDLYNKYRKRGLTISYIRNVKSRLRLIERFETKGLYSGFPNKRTKATAKRIIVYEILSPEYKDFLDYFKLALKERNYKKNSVRNFISVITTFLKVMQEFGATRLSKISEKNVLDFFYQNEKQEHGYNYKYGIKFALNIYSAKNPKAKEIITYLPNISKAKKNIPYLTSDEIAKIKHALSDYSNTLDYRDRAVGALFLYTGIRRCDIANLKLSDIHLKAKRLVIQQQKTGTTLTLPLRPIVWNPIYDYIKEERPRIKGHLFLTKESHKAIGTSTIRIICNRIFDAAKVRMHKVDYRGTHLFRHYVATKLLENDVPLPIISSALGHANPQSTETYLSADFVNLKKCALDVSKFPIRKEVFDV